jgi:hypothetical protein
MATNVTLSVIASGSTTILLKVLVRGGNLTFQVNPGATAIKAFSPGTTVSVDLVVPIPGSNRTKTFNLSWTVETFAGVDPTGQLVQTIASGICEIQFSQRCILSESGIATWRLRFEGNNSSNPFSYNLSTEPNFGLGNNVRPIAIDLGGRDDPSFELANDPNARSNNQEFRFFSVSNAQAVVAEIKPVVSGQLCYRSKTWGPNVGQFSIGDGVRLDNRAAEVWQSCLYRINAPQNRLLRVGVEGISTANILNSWNQNIAKRYYEGLAVNHLFSAMPEISADPSANPNSLPWWFAELILEDKYPITIKSADWVWFRRDADMEYPGLYSSLQKGTVVSEPAACIATKVRSVSTIYGDKLNNVSCTLRMFRTEDGTPVKLSGLTLSAVVDPDLTAGWWISLSGHGTGSGELQKVRCGAFELQLPFSSTQPFTMDVKADYAPPAPTPSPFPLMPQVTCSMKSFPLFDVVPAGQDDLDKDQYSTANESLGKSLTVAQEIQDPIITACQNEISVNMARETSLVFRNPAVGDTPTADGDWSLGYAEQSRATTKQTILMQLRFTAHTGFRAAAADESVLVLDRVPFTFADVHFHPLTESDGPNAVVVAQWDSLGNEWKIVQMAASPSYLVLPPQIIAEEAVTEDLNNNYPQGIDSPKPPRMAMGLPTVITYAQDEKSSIAKVPWDIRRLLTDASLHVSRLDYEMLYGLACNTSADHVRLTEAATLYGSLRQQPPELPPGVPESPTYDLQYLFARLHWSRVYREYQSRLGLFIVEDPTAADPDGFIDTKTTVCQLRLKDMDVPPSQKQQVIDGYMNRSEISADFSNPDFKGGALVGVNNADIFQGIVSNRRSDPGHAAVLNPRFSVLGGFGTTRARFDSDRSTLINTISMGRTVTYTVERVGRIACHWNRAKHVIVYERTVVPSRQFFGQQQKSAFRGLPLLRKVEEYIEFLEVERHYAEELQGQEAAFAKGFKCGEKKRISVDSGWGSTVPGQGWKVPLWNEAASLALPDVYPKPQLFLQVSTPEQSASPEGTPLFLTHDCSLTNPEEVFFFTSTVETKPDTDSWAAVECVDCVGYPLLTPDVTIYDGGDLNATPPPEFPTPPGWELVTFTIEPPPSGVHATDGIVKTKTPIAAQLKKVTVSRGVKPKPLSAKDLLANDPLTYQRYTQNAVNLAALPQTFSDIRRTITSELVNPNTSQTVSQITTAIQNMESNCRQLQAQLPDALDQLSKGVQNPFNDAAAKLSARVDGVKATVSGKLSLLSANLTKVANNVAGINHNDADIVQATRLLQLIQATPNEVPGWLDPITNKVKSINLDRAIRSWSVEIEQSVGSYSPLREVAVAFAEFRNFVALIQRDINQLDAGSTAKAIVTICQSSAQTFGNAVNGATRGFSALQTAAPAIDPSMILLALNTTGISGQFEIVIQIALKAVSDATQLPAARKAAVDLQKGLNGITAELNSIASLLQEDQLDLLRQSPTIQNLYTISNIVALQIAIQQIKPDVLVAEMQTNCVARLTAIGSKTLAAVRNLAADIAQWIANQASPIVNDVNQLLGQLSGLVIGAVPDFNQIQASLDQYASQVQNTIGAATQTLNQYVRQPLMQLYQPVATGADNLMRVVRAFGEPPQVPHLDIQPASIAYVYDYLNSKVPITPILARANQIDQSLNALGVKLPATHLADVLVPANLKNFNLSDVIPNFSGLKLPGLFSGIKLPEVANQNIAITHGWEPQARRGWLQADVNVPFADRMVVFQAGPLGFCLTKSTFKAQCKIQNDGAQIQQSISGSIRGTWSLEIGDSMSLIDFADTALVFDDSGKLQFQFNPASIKLSDSLKAVSALVQSFSDPSSGFNYGVTPTGVKCAFALPVPDTSALTSGMTGLKFSTSLALDFTPAFVITLAVAVSSKDRPFNFAIFILGGCGYLEAGVSYNVDKKTFSPVLDLAIGCSASLAIAFGPISGGVYAQFAIELQKSGSGFRAGAFFQITGHVSILGIISVDIVFRLEASYGDGVMVATGHFSITIKLFMFSVSVSRDVSMTLGSHGQSGELIFPSAPRTEIAAIAGVDGTIPGLSDAFAALTALTPAQRYVAMLL